jgi:transposase
VPVKSIEQQEIQGVASRFRLLNERLRQYDRLLERVFRADERCKRLGQIEGVGLLTATALVAAVGNGQAFSSGRYLSAWLGLVPRQYSTAGRPVLLGISKRGDRYLTVADGGRGAFSDRRGGAQG